MNCGELYFGFLFITKKIPQAKNIISAQMRYAEMIFLAWGIFLVIFPKLKTKIVIRFVLKKAGFQ